MGEGLGLRMFRGFIFDLGCFFFMTILDHFDICSKFYISPRALTAPTMRRLLRWGSQRIFGVFHICWTLD